MKLKHYLLGMVSLFSAMVTNAKPLIIYFSQPEKVDLANIDAYSGASVILKNGQGLGATEYLAKEIQAHTKGDLWRMETVQTYPDSHQALLDFAQAEQRKGIKPALKAKPNLDGYDTIFVGFPVWWYQMPMPLYTFFEENDFSGKKVILFTAHGGSRFSGAGQAVKKLQPNANVIEGFEAYLFKSTRADKDVEQRLARWLEKMNK